MDPPPAALEPDDFSAGNVTISWHALSRSGSRKPRNDDAWTIFASDLNGGVPQDADGSAGLDFHDLVFAVADGMGGGNAGDLAASLLLAGMGDIIPETFKAAAAGMFPDHLAQLSIAIQRVHQHLNEHAAADAQHHGMAATLALVWITPENAYLANAGDSRIYHCRGDDFRQLSRDHTSAWGQWKRGEISEPVYRCHPRRAALYEVIGGGHEMVHPHFEVLQWRAGDRLIICSDGLIDGLWERHIGDALAHPHRTPAETAHYLVKRAIDNSGIDDTTLIVIHIDPCPHPQASASMNPTGASEIGTSAAFSATENPSAEALNVSIPSSGTTPTPILRTH